MADSDSNIPKRPNPVPDPHDGEPDPVPDAHTRPGAEAVVRPDQQESDLGPIGELMSAASTEAASEVSGSEAAEAEGVEAAQIFSLMLATAVTLGLAVVGVFFLVAYVADDEAVERDAIDLYPELQETRTRAAAKLEAYSREDSLYRMPIETAMASIAETYGARQDEAAVPPPQNFNMVYLDANQADRLGLRPVGANDGVLPTQEPNEEVEDEGMEEGTEEPRGEAAGDDAVMDEPEDR